MRTRAVVFDDAQTLPHQFQVHDNVAVNTGILRADGTPIMRDPNPIGYVTKFEQTKPRIRVKAGRSPA